MIVVDVGCHPQGPEESVHKLVERFAPAILFGFDPFPDLVEGVECVGETLVVRRRLAAWGADEILDYSVDGINSSAHPSFRNPEKAVEVEGFNLAAFLVMLPPVELVLKIDAEGAEYPILERLLQDCVDDRVSLLLVEWHGDGEADRPMLERRIGGMSKPELLEQLRCPVEEWE